MNITIEQALAKLNGEFQSGLYLCEMEHLMIDQDSWDNSDPAKGIAFHLCPWWIITNDGAEPFPIVDEQDFQSYQDVISEDQ